MCIHNVCLALLLALSLALVLSPALAAGGKLAEPLKPALRQMLDDELRAIVGRPAAPLASLAVVALRDGVPVYEQALGWRSVERGLPATVDTLYRVASVSKLVTAIGFMKLVEQGRVDLDADASRYLGFALRHPAHPARVVTPRMLLSHTSSLRDPGDLLPSRVGVSLSSVLAPGGQAVAGSIAGSIAGSVSGSIPGSMSGAAAGSAAGGAPAASAAYWARPASQAPGSGWFHYANVNSVVLGTIIERVSGQRFDRYMKAEVLAPLGVVGGYHPAADLTAAEFTQLATLYRKSPDGGVHWNPGGPWVPQGPDRTAAPPAPIEGLDAYDVGSNAGVFGPQGGLRTSVRGLTRLMQMLLNRGTLDGVTVLRAATVNAMLTPQWSLAPPGRPRNGDTERGIFQRWGLGPQLFTGQGGSRGRGDRIGTTPRGLTGAGHLGEAWGLCSGFVFDPHTRKGLIYIVGGMGARPADYPGARSAFYAWEEQILQALTQRALLQQGNPSGPPGPPGPR